MSAHEKNMVVDPDNGFCIVGTVKSKASNKNSKEILTNMQLDFPSNSVTAILGPSGSGKTTLLSVVTDSIPTNIYAAARVHIPGDASFIPQDDHLHGFYTCKSYMQHYARMSGALNSHTTTEMNERIDKILSQLGLTDQANTVVGDLFFKGLSGGQKRRLSIALEVLTQPQNLFLDEPTSGLDAESALQVLEFLKTYVREAKGRRVILTIHQPSSFIWLRIDHAILLSKGQLMYNGPRALMETFFTNAGHPTPFGWNSADHYVTMVNDEFREHSLSVSEWATIFKNWSTTTKKQDTKDMIVAENNAEDDDGIMMEQAPSDNIVVLERSPSFILSRGLEKKETLRSKSLFVIVELTYRYFLNLFFNPGILGTRLAMYGLLAGMVGALFWDLGSRDDFESVQSRTAVLFYCVSFFIFMSVAVLPFTVMERDIVDKEVRNMYYHPCLYQVAQALSSIPGCALLAGVVTGLIIGLTGLEEPAWYFLNMFLSLIVAEALAVLISHIVPHFIIGMAMLAGLYGFFMLFMGFMVVPSDFPNWLSWLYEAAFHTYSWRTFMSNEFTGKVFSTGAFATGEDVLKFYEIDDVDRSFDMLILVLYAIVVHMISFIVLHLRYYMFRGKIQEIRTEYVQYTTKVSYK